MVKAGDELVNIVTGLRTAFRQTAQDTGGELLQVDWRGAPGWTTGPDHVRLILSPVALLGRLLGYRAEYPYRDATPDEAAAVA